MALLNIKSAMQEEELLAGLLIEDKLYDRVVIQEISGEEEDILAEDKGSVSEKISQVIANCVERILPAKDETDASDITDKNRIKSLVKGMAIGDRMYLFIRLRVLSLDNNFLMDCKSPSDNNEFKVIVDLNTLDVKKLEDKKVRMKTFKLPKSEIDVEIKLATGYDEEKLTSIQNGHAKMSTSILLRIEKIAGEKPTLENLKRLPLKDRNAIRTELESFDVGVDTKVIVKSPSDDFEYETELGLTQKGFFFP
jgi:hypothetical protein